MKLISLQKRKIFTLVIGNTFCKIFCRTLNIRQLEETNPSATESEKIAYVNDETSPSFKRRVVSALQSGGEAAIEEFWHNPYVNLGKAIIKGWVKPE